MNHQERAMKLYSRIRQTNITNDERRSLIAAALAEVRAETIEECAKVADFGAGNMELYSEGYPGSLGAAEHKFAAHQVRELAKGIRALLPTQELCGARKVTEGEL